MAATVALAAATGCDRFPKAHKANQTPQIESYVIQVASQAGLVSHVAAQEPRSRSEPIHYALHSQIEAPPPGTGTLELTRRSRRRSWWSWRIRLPCKP